MRLAEDKVSELEQSWLTEQETARKSRRQHARISGPTGALGGGSTVFFMSDYEPDAYLGAELDRAHRELEAAKAALTQALGEFNDASKSDFLLGSVAEP